jgi:hypothetical protein
VDGGNKGDVIKDKTTMLNRFLLESKALNVCIQNEIDPPL